MKIIQEATDIIHWYKNIPKAYSDVQKLMDSKRRLSCLYYEIQFESGQARIALEEAVFQRKSTFAKKKSFFINEGNSAAYSEALATEAIEPLLAEEATAQGIHSHLKSVCAAVSEVLDTMKQHISFQKLFLPENRTL